MWALLMMWQCINEERGKMSLMRMTLLIHSYLDKLCLACNLENNNRWNYALRGRCFIIVSNVFRWCVILGNRVHGISTETSLRMKPSLHSYLDNLCLACNLENNNIWNYALRGRYFVIVSNVFRWCVTLGNRVHGISTEAGLIYHGPASLNE
jgi:hypothetical protein